MMMILKMISLNNCEQSLLKTQEIENVGRQSRQMGLLVVSLATGIIIETNY